jgi:hypothetical protein
VLAAGLCGATEAAVGGPGCHSQWPVVAYRAGGRLEQLPRGSVLPVACATETGYATSESTLAVTNRGTLVYSPAQTENSMARSVDSGASWTLTYPATEQYTSLWNTVDPDVVADPRTGRVLWVHATGDLRTVPGVTENSPLPNAIQTIIAYAHGFQVYASSDDGRSFTTADYSHENMGDWEKIFVGPPPSLASGAPRPVGYPDVVYVCANSPFEVSGPGRQCYRSLDGGLTFSSAGFVFPSPTAPADSCPALASNGGVVDSAGTTYQPVSCSQGAYVAVSHDEGSSYTFLAEKDAPPSNGLSGSLQLAVDSADNLYGLWVSGDRLYLAISRDHAQSWSTPLVVTTPGVHGVDRPAFATHGPGQVAITYYASTAPSATKLTAYVTQTADALDAQPLFYGGAINDPAAPIFHDYGVGTGGTPRADFIGAAYDPAGTFWAGVVKQPGPADSNGNVPTTGYVGRLAFSASTPDVLGGPSAGGSTATPGAATLMRGATACTAGRRLTFRIKRVPGGRVVRVVVYVNGRRVLRKHGRKVRSVSFSRPPGRQLVVRIVSTNNKGGTVVTLRTFRSCTRTKVRGRVHRHR